MCDPSGGWLTAASIAFSGLTTGAQYMAEKQQAKASQQVDQQNKTNALSAYRFNVAQTNQKAIQQDAATSNQSQQISLESKRKAGEAIASSNAAGLDLTTIQSDFLRQESNYKGVLKQQSEWQKQQNQAEMLGFGAQAKDRIAAYRPMAEPSLAGAIAGLGTKAVGAYSSYADKLNAKGG